MPEKVIEVRDLRKEYGQTVAVDDISFDVYRGEIFSLVGPNGAGKTTTVEILECLRDPTTGSAEIFGFDIVGGEEEIKERIGVMPQEFNTFERLSVKENVKLISDIYGGSGDLKQKLETLELWDSRDKKFGDLSGGMKRRAGIAMALISDPELLFLDEPTTGLDPQARRKLWGTIEDLKELGVTIFLTSHYMDEVEELSDRVSIILDGKILSTAKVDDLISEYGGEMKMLVDGGEKAKGVLEGLAEDVYVDEDDNLVGTFEDREKAAEAHYSLFKDLSEKFQVKMVEPSMEDVFLHVAGGRISESGELVE